MRREKKKREKTINSLDHSLDLVAKNADFLSLDQRQFLLGQYHIIENDDFYEIYDTKTHKMLYGELFLVESAVAIVVKLKNKQISLISDIISLDNQYGKHHIDMMFYKNTYLHTKLGSDAMKLEITLNRYNESRDIAKEIKRKIRNMGYKLNNR